MREHPLHFVRVSIPVRILGAGPSGLAAAITLAHAGQAVDVFERRSDCGMRFGGDLQGLENWSGDTSPVDEFRSYGIDIDFHCAPFTSGVQTNGRRADRMHFPTPAFFVVKRGRATDALDQSLKRQALAAGVQIHFTQTRTAADVDIDASGPAGRAAFAVDTGIVFETDAPDQAVALLNDRAGLKGYSYLLVTQGYGCCCAMSFDAFPTVQAQSMEARRLLIEEAGINVWNPRRVGGLGHYALRSAWTDGRTRRVGEAAGLQDFLWGFGIRMAVRSGVLAARSLLEGTEYATVAERTFAPSRRAGEVNRLLWEVGGVADYALVMAALRLRGPYPLLRWLHRDTLFQRALHPLARWWAERKYAHLRAGRGPFRLGEHPRRSVAADLDALALSVDS